MKRRQFVLGGLQSVAVLSILQASGCGSTDSVSSLGGSSLAQGGASGISPRVLSDTVLASNTSGAIIAKVDSSSASVTVTQTAAAGGSPIQIVDRGPLQGGLLSNPTGAVSDDQGNLYVLDSALAVVQVYNSSGNPSLRIGGPGEGDGQFMRPSAIAFSSSRKVLYVADSGLHRVSAFSLNGTFLGKFGSLGLEPGRLNGPRALALDAAGNLHVGEVGNSRVSVFSPEGSLLRIYGSRGTDLGQFLAINALAVLADGRSLVSDPVRGLVTIFSNTGVAESSFVPATAEGKVGYATNLIVGPGGTIYMTVVASGQPA